MPAPISYRHNQTEVERTIDAAPQATRVFMRGPELDGFAWDIGDAVWEIGAVSGSNATLLADAGGEPIAFDRQLDGLYIEKAGSTAHWKILSSVVDGQVLALEDAPFSLGAGDFVHVRRPPVCPGAPLRRLTYLDRPGARDAWGIVAKVVQRADIPPVDNIMPNPYFADWQGVGTDQERPRSWNIDSVSTFTRNDDRRVTKYGKYSATAFVSVAGPKVEKWGVYSDWVSFQPTAERPFVCVQWSFTTEVGVPNFYIEFDTVGDASNIVQVPDQPDNLAELILAIGSGGRATSERLNERVENLRIVDQATNVWEIGAKRFRLVVEPSIPGQHLLRIHLDAVQVLQASAPAEAFYDRRASNTLWHLANQYLREHGEPQRSYVVGFLDHYRHDPARYPHLQVREGAPVRVRDITLDLDVDTRVIEVRRNGFRGRETQLEVANAQPSFLRDQVVKPRPRIRANAPILRDVSGDGDVDGHISGVRVELLVDPDGDGQDYEEVRWDHTQAIEEDDGGIYTVNITSKLDGSLATGRDPRLESTGVNAIQRVGSYRTPITIGDEGTGTAMVNVYVVQLLKSGTVIATIAGSRTLDHYVTS